MKRLWLKLPLKYRKHIRIVLRRLESVGLQTVVKSRLLCRLYYAVVSPAFGREMQAVLAGKIAHSAGRNAADAYGFQLRRNIHRIEKGLIMQPRRAVFAKAYIEETVEGFEKASKRPGGDIGLLEYEWYSHVLEEFFANTGRDEVLDRARSRFEALRKDPAPAASGVRVPYKSASRPDSGVSYDGLFALARQRRSVRWYEQRPVPREAVDRAIAAAAQSPSACNRQPFEFYVYDDAELVRKISAVPGGTAGYAENFPMIVVLVGRLDAYFSERDRHVIYIDAGLAAMSFMFALETQGLSSCSINWPDTENKEVTMHQLMRLKPYERPVMLLSVGYPDSEALIPFSEKKNLDQLRRYNGT